MGSGLPLPNIAHRIAGAVAYGVAQSRILSRAAGIERVRDEFDSLGVELGDTESATINVRRDIARGHRYGAGYATTWLDKAEGDTVSVAAAAANVATLASLTRIATTESAQAYNEGREKAADDGLPDTATQLLKVWEAHLDRYSCAICEAADGTIVGIRESFPAGEQPVHPHCRCTWSVLTYSEAHGHGFIAPKPLAKVIDLPVTPTVAAESKSVAEASLKTVRVTETYVALDDAAAAAYRQEFRDAGIQMSPETHDINKLRKAQYDVFQKALKPAEVKSLIGNPHDLPGAESARINLTAFRGEVTIGAQVTGHDGQQLAEVTRDFKRRDDKIIAHHAIMQIGESQKGAGLGARLLSDQLTAYQAAGVAQIELEAAWDGQYVWPRMGFELSGAETAFPKLQAQFADHLESTGLTAKDAKAYSRQFENINQLALSEKDGRKLGKEFLLQRGNEGGHLLLDMHLTLDPNDENYKQVKTYLASKAR